MDASRGPMVERTSWLLGLVFLEQKHPPTNHDESPKRLLGDHATDFGANPLFGGWKQYVTVGRLAVFSLFLGSYRFDHPYVSGKLVPLDGCERYNGLDCL